MVLEWSMQMKNERVCFTAWFSRAEVDEVRKKLDAIERLLNLDQDGASPTDQAE